jgi:AAA+ ATPase superfamily predicted ATPase
MKKLFVNRESELQLFRDRLEQMKKGHAVRIALWGHRRIGKTMLIGEVADDFRKRGIITLNVDLEGIVGTPETFSSRYSEEILKNYLRSNGKKVDEFASLHDLMVETAHPDVRNAINYIIQELGKSKPDRNRLLTMCLGLPKVISKAEKRSVAVFLDEFQTLLELERYKEIKNILGIFRSLLQQQEDIGYVIAGSAITIIRSLIINESSPLYLQFERLELRPFDKASARKLVGKFLSTDQRTLGKIYEYTWGHPFYITTLCRRLSGLNKEIKVDEEQVHLAFFQEVLSTEGTIFNYCNYLYRHTIESVKGRGIVMSILDILSKDPGRNQSEIAQILHQAQGAVRNYLLPLVEIDVIKSIDNRYYFTDPLFAYWIANYRQGIDLTDLSRKKDLERAIKSLEQRFQQVSVELGRAKESDVRELMRKFHGQEIDGKLFHVDGNLKLNPMREVDSYNSEDGKTDLDIVATNRKRWAVEVKWRLKSSGLEEVRKFWNKVNRYEKIEGKRIDVMWFISKSGFTTGAIDFGSRKRIYLSTGEDYEEIVKLIDG